MSDAVSGTYRTKAELDEYMKRDPIMLLRMHMQENEELTEDGLHKLDEEINIVAIDRDLTAILDRHYDDDLARSVRMQSARWDNRSAMQRVVEAVVTPIKRFF